MSSILKVDTIQDQSGNNIINESGDTITIGASGDTISIPSGATLSSTDPLVFPAGTVSAPAITTTGDTNTGMFFPAADEIAFTEGGTEAMRINSNGNIALAGNIGIGGATPTTSGTGITFPATASASTDANTLDDYEEGSWTPANATVSLATAIGSYTKIGNTVFARANVTYPSTASASNSELTGLPFTPANNVANYQGTVSLTDTGLDNLYTFPNINTTTILIRNNLNFNIALSAVSNKSIIFFVTYTV